MTGTEPRPRPSQGHPGSLAFHSRAPPSEKVAAGHRHLSPSSRPPGPAPHTLPPLPSLLSPGGRELSLSQSGGDSAGTREREKGEVGAAPERPEEKFPPWPFQIPPRRPFLGQALGLGESPARIATPSYFLLPIFTTCASGR